MRERTDDAAVERDRRVAGAIRSRVHALDCELESCARQYDDTMRLAEAFQAEFIGIHDGRRTLARSLEILEQHLVQVGAYYCDAVQVSAILNRLNEVGTDPKRFCAYMGVGA